MTKPTVVLETNLLMTASGLAEQAGRECIERCIKAIEQIQQGIRTLALDTSLLILTEYQENLRTAQSSLGYLFLRKWLDAHWHEIVLVDILLANGETGEFSVLQDVQEFMRGFDKSDWKFIATARTAQAQTGATVPILNATDGDWCEFLDAMHHIGVVVEFVCPELMPEPEKCR